MSGLADRIRAELARVDDPELRRPLTELGMIGAVDTGADDAGPVRVELLLTIVGCPAAGRIEADARAAIERAVGDAPYELEVGVMTPRQRDELVQRVRGSRPSGHPFGEDALTRVIAVTSGKGGVGKSTVTVNLAAAMAADGLAVGIVDADVHGFSIPGLLGMPPGTQPTQVGELMLPPVAHGVSAISIGMFLRSPDEIVAWRGPMLHRTLEQFLTDVHFGDLDVLLLDLPPGTGDIAISLGQLLPGADAIVVTTPQPAAAEVAWRSGAVARKTGMRVVGVVETLSPAAAPDGGRFALFGDGGGAAVAERLDAPLLAQVPISTPLRESGDAGVPLVLAHPDDPAAIELRAAARALAQRPRGLAGRPLGLSPA